MTLAEKIAKASLAVGSLAADKTNKDQNYDYISADQILSKAGAALAGVGVVLFPAILDEDVTRLEYTNQYNKTISRYDARITFNMILSDGETSLESVWIGRGSDYAVPDKALYKAITSGHKYYLMKLLNIGVGNEDGEHESEDDEGKKKPEKKQEKPTQQPASVAQPKSLMTVEMAKAETNRDGVAYGDLDTDTLTHMANSLQKAIAKNGMTPEEREEKQRKLDACLVILKSRA